MTYMYMHEIMGNMTVSKTNLYRASLLVSQIYHGLILVMMINPLESLKGGSYIFINFHCSFVIG